MVAAAARTRTVLIAAEATGVRDRFAEALREAGLRTLDAARASDLVDWFGPDRPGADLLVLDLGLGDGDGLTLVRRVRDHAGSLPIIVFSGSVTSAEVVRGLTTLGVTGYVNEHVETEQILPALAHTCFPTASTGGAAPGSSSRSRCPTGSTTRSAEP